MPVYCFILDATTILQHQPYFYSLLDKNQQAFYQTKTQKRKKQYLFSRLLLRYALAHCANQSMDSVDIIEVESSKPESVFSQKNGLLFTLSHSGNLFSVVVAKSIVCPYVGVDIECLKPIRDAAPVPFIFNEKQKTIFLGLVDDEEKLHFYYQLWTRKEALIKAVCGSVFSNAFKASYFHNADSQNLNVSSCVVKTAFLEEPQLLSQPAYLSVCSKGDFELRVSEVYANDLSLSLDSKKLGVRTTSYVSSLDE